MITILILFMVVLFLLAVAALPKKKQGTDVSSLMAMLNPAQASGPSRPVASAWSKQTAADMLDEIALADERARVIETMRRAVQNNAAPAAPAAGPSAAQPASVI
ncbi:MAG: hypothetical protein ACO1RT_21040 [Planctomycetaceae bacterium]